MVHSPHPWRTRRGGYRLARPGSPPAASGRSSAPNDCLAISPDRFAAIGRSRSWSPMSRWSRRPPLGKLRQASFKGLRFPAQLTSGSPATGVLAEVSYLKLIRSLVR
jgi:hypothetical protein